MEESIDSITSTLLARVKAHDADAWDRLIDTYGPLVYHWCLRKGLSRETAEDVGQEVFLAVSRGMETYEHETFRGWLKTITHRKILDCWEKMGKQPIAQGGTDFQVRMNDIPGAESTDDGAAGGDEEKILRLSVLETIEHEFSAQDLAAVRRVVVDEKSPAEVAQELKISRNQVYLAKSRVLRRLREKFGEGNSQERSITK
jgi:RNA polymerase sigma-70 factor (ECF subfamily)